MKELSIDQLEMNKLLAQVKLAKLPYPSNPQGRQLLGQISTIDNILKGKEGGLSSRESLLKKQVVGLAMTELIKKKQRYI